MEKELIAIIGMAGRFPQADSVAAFWRNLVAGRDCITRQTPIVTAEEGYACVNAYGKMDHIYEFDHSFFDISNGDADLMEPQERLLLMCAYHALEDAGYANGSYDGKIGIICGAQENEYYLKDRFENKRGNRLTAETEKFLNAGISLAGRISFKLNLTGPSIIVNTACSTSLTAVQMAADMIGNGQADLMLAGGTNVSIQQENYVHIEGMSAKDGVVRPFDRHSTGFVPGSGLGLVVLKQYGQALQDGDTIYAVIKGGAVGNDGNRKIGYTAPSVQGECDVIQGALQNAGFTGDEIDYIETHGTATVLGDCIEIRALNKAFEAADADVRIPIGSLKGNYGHLNSAAGIAGLIKAGLILKHQLIPPSIHNEEENDELKTSTKFYVNREKLEASSRQKRIENVGVSSFGLGGMNAHLILGAPEKRIQEKRKRRAELIVCSAKEESSLHEYKEAFLYFLKSPPEDLGKASYTSLVRRRSYDKKTYMICRDGAMDEPIRSNGKKVMLQICAGGDVESYITEIAEALPRFYLLYQEEMNKEDGENPAACMKQSYLKAFLRILQDMGFPCKTLPAGGNQAIRAIDNEFCVYPGDGWTMPSVTEAEDIYLIKLDQKEQIWISLLQFMGCAWRKDYPAVWASLFFADQRQICSIPHYCFLKVMHKIAFVNAPSIQEIKDPEDTVDYDEIRTFFQVQLEDDTIDVHTRIDDLAIDSMTILVIKSEIAERFHCTFSIQDFYQCETIKEVIDLVKESDQQAIAQNAQAQYDDIDNLFDEL